MSESTEHVTVVPADLYDEMTADDTPAEPNVRLQEAAGRAEGLIDRK